MAFFMLFAYVRVSCLLGLELSVMVGASSLCIGLLILSLVGSDGALSL